MSAGRRLSGARKRRLRGLVGAFAEAEREMRALGYNQREINAVAFVEHQQWPAWARKPRSLAYVAGRVL